MRLIDADKVLDKFYSFTSDNRMFVLLEDVVNAPTVDAIEVVRCKDCRYKKPNGYCAKELTPYEGFATEKEADRWFCAYGERKEK